jgi:hypothetical protein
MRLAGARWRVLVSTALSHRVVRPARRLQHAPLSEVPWGAELTVDRTSTVPLAAAWWLAARSPHSIIYLPLRQTPANCGVWSRKLDLVLLHHSLGFRPSRWKEVRARLGAGSPQTVRLPERPFPVFDRADHDRRYHREFRDLLRWDVAADTLFVTGSRLAFNLAGEELRMLAEDVPALLAKNPRQFHTGTVQLCRNLRDRYDPTAQLRFEYCYDHR